MTGFAAALDDGAETCTLAAAAFYLLLLLLLLFLLCVLHVHLCSLPLRTVPLLTHPLLLSTSSETDLLAVCQPQLVEAVSNSQTSY